MSSLDLERPGLDAKRPPVLTTPSRTRQELVREAIRIAESLSRHHLATPDGGATWIGPHGYGTELSPLRIRPLGPHLYHGTTGVALFLAALARVEPDRRWRDLALVTLAPLRRKLASLVADPQRAAALRIPLGGLIGLGSFLYGLLVVGELLEEPELIDEAHRVTELVTEDRIRDDERVRVQTGAAGLVLALLALNRRRPGPNRSGRTPVELALVCGHHLASSRVSFEGRPPAWPLSPGKPPLAGFSYGASGIACALLRLHALVPRPELRRAALDGLAFVRTLYSPDEGAWRDVRGDLQARYKGPTRGTWRDWWLSGGPLEPLDRPPEQDSETYVTDMWCHGTAGILLGLIGGLPAHDSTEIRTEIHSAVRRLVALADTASGDRPDDLCCGGMGQVEALLVAADQLVEPSCLTAARTLVDRMRRRATRRSRYTVSAARGTPTFAPSLFQGIAGVGYELLRLAEPTRLPCLLLMDPAPSEASGPPTVPPESPAVRSTTVPDPTEAGT